jgi:hypothetical protein
MSLLGKLEWMATEGDGLAREAIGHITDLRERNHQHSVKNADMLKALDDAGLEFHYGPNGPAIARRQRDDVVHNQAKDT